MIFLTRQQHLQRKRIGRHNVHNGLLKPKNSEVRVFYATKTTFVYLRHRQHQQQCQQNCSQSVGILRAIFFAGIKSDAKIGVGQ